MAEKKKFYNFCVLNNAVTKSGNAYVAATIKGTLCNVDQRESDGKTIVTANLPVSGRDKYLKTVLGDNIEVNEEGTVWVRVTMWENTAERFLKLLGDNEKLTLVVCGSIKTRTYEDREGNTRYSVELTVNDFTL